MNVNGISEYFQSTFQNPSVGTFFNVCILITFNTTTTNNDNNNYDLLIDPLGGTSLLNYIN